MSDRSDDKGHSAIDRVYDFVDNVVDAFDRGADRAKDLDDRAARRASTAIAKRPSWRIEEVTDATSGAKIWIVTDGAGARAECTTPELAATILRKLEAG